MKAIRFHAPGGPEVLRRDNLPEPVAQPGAALVRVSTAGVNQADPRQHRTAPDTPAPGASPGRKIDQEATAHEAHGWRATMRVLVDATLRYAAQAGAMREGHAWSPARPDESTTPVKSPAGRPRSVVLEGSHL